MKNNANKIIEKNMKTTKSLLQEFKKFISRGNVVDLAVGVIIGGAFGGIVTSLVNDIIMPAIGVLLGGIDFSSLVVQIGDAQISYGSFLKNVVDFLIIAASVFIFVKIIKTIEQQAQTANSKDAKTPAAPENEQTKLLREIRDSLRTAKK